MSPEGIRNIALVGFRATGKSSVGRIVALELGWSFVDMDEELVSVFGESIDKFVARKGWPSFRKEESRLLERLAQGERQVIATGGGIILSESNRSILRKDFLVVWLKASARVLIERLRSDPTTSSYRPPLTDLRLEDEVCHLLKEREPFYREVAHHVIDTSSLSLDDVSRLVLDRASNPS